jgi:photosystem II stability/assembly factor-like uncharacterized protein
MYFSQIRIDPNDDNTIYVLGDVPSPIFRSTNGGSKFDNLATARGVHADAHALWINPADSRHLIIGCDGGFYVTYDKGVKWNHLNGYALGQFYHVCVDNQKPYKIYGGLQDNGSWGGLSDSLRRTGMTNDDWVFINGGDGFVCRVDPTDPDLVYAESQGGNISRRNLRTGEGAGIRPSRQQGDPEQRFNWNTPYILSSHNPSIFYCGSQFVYRSIAKGANLKQISPELTRTKQGSLVAIAESPRNADVLWAGSDDGYLWITSDGGTKWENVTPNLLKAGLPAYRWIATIETSKEKDGRAYIALDGHRSDDDKPYLFVTDDYGATWKSITSNLPEFGSTRCLREDIVNANVLYCGTEFGAFVSINSGASWTKLGSGLPTVACHEFAQPTTASELVVATHGRSVWILDIAAIRQLKPAQVKPDALALLAPSPATRWRLKPSSDSPYSLPDGKFIGQNPTRGAGIDYVLGTAAKDASLKIVDVNGKLVREIRTIPKTAGLHRIVWDFTGVPAQQPAQGSGRVRRPGASVAPAGTYAVVLTVDGKEFKQSLVVENDPSIPAGATVAEDELEEQDEEDEERNPQKTDR